MTRVLFLNPPRRADGTRTLFNNATLTLASYLARRGLETRIQPLVGPYWLETLADALEAFQPDVAAVSCKWWDTLYGATEVARMVRKLRPGTRIVAGGQTATSFANELVTRTEFDAVVRGDGERPLYEYALGEPGCNLTFATAGGADFLPTTYVQGREPEDLRLVRDLTRLGDEVLLSHVGYTAPFIWTGKGCRATCLFCAGSALGHKRLFGRKGYMYRDLEHVLHDMDVFGQWSRGNFLFDFDPVADPDKADYYRELFSMLPKKRHHVVFYCWSLPDLAFLELLDETFLTCHVSLDAQTYSQDLRRQLASKNRIKPYVSNAAIEQALALCAARPTMDAAVYGIIGLAGETSQHVRQATEWVERLLGTYGDVLAELEVTPLSAEPGALLEYNPDRYGMVVLRKSFEDYMEFTRMAYYSSQAFHEAVYDPALPHPYGCHGREERPDRVYHDYRALKQRLDDHFDKRETERAGKSLEVFDDRVRLRLCNRTRKTHLWQLVVWAAGAALGMGKRLLEVDATRAWVSAPSLEVLAYAEIHAWSLERLPGLARAVEQGRLEIRIKGSQHQHWGALEQIGASIDRCNLTTRT